MTSTPGAIELLSAAIFAVALIHTFAAKQLERLSHRYPRHAGMFHLLGEVEVVFGFWAIVLVWHGLSAAPQAPWPMPSRATTRNPCSCSS